MTRRSGEWSGRLGQLTSSAVAAGAFTNHGQFYYRRIEQQRQVMEKYGEGQKQIWLTEYGWCSDNRLDGYDECAETTTAQQAANTIWAKLRSLPPAPYSVTSC